MFSRSVLRFSVEKGATEEVVKVLTKATNRSNLQKETAKKLIEEPAEGEKAFGAPTQKADDKKFKKFA